MTQTKVAIGNTTTKVLDANTNRVYVCLINDSDEVMYLKFGASAVSGEGYRVNAGGGSLEIFAREMFPEYLGQVNAICASGSKSMCVVEVSK